MNRKTEYDTSRHLAGARERGAASFASIRGRGLALLKPALAFALVPGISFAATVPVHATIDNTATASGTYGTQLVQSDAATLNLEFEPLKPALSVAADGILDASGGADGNAADAGDTISVTVTVSNTGNVAVTGVKPMDAALAAAGVAGTAPLSFQPETADIAPHDAVAFKATYTLSAEDVYRAAGTETGIAISVGAAGSAKDQAVVAEAATGMVAIEANPRLSIAKEFEVAKAEGNLGEKIEAGDTITYTYTVTNTGNVAIDGITISDDHEGTVLKSDTVASAADGPYDETQKTPDPLGVSADAGVNGSWDKLGAGGAVTFTFRHVVTQAEFEAQ